jgi:hypothetical protein
MTLLFDLFRGVFIGFGFAFGFLFIIIILVKMLLATKSKKKTYNSNDLIKPFFYYKERLVEMEKYEEMIIVDNIMDNLGKDIIVPEVYQYEIKSDTQLVLENDEEYGRSKINFATTYVVVKQKAVLEDISSE